MGNKNKAGREARKPKASKKAKGVATPAPTVIPPSPHAKDQGNK